MENEQNLSFSERNGLVDIPPQLKLGEVSSELKRLFDYHIGSEVERVRRYGPGGSYFDRAWRIVAMDLHVRFFKEPRSSFRDDPSALMKKIETFIARSEFNWLFDLIEFFVRHPGCSAQLKADLASAFIEARAAYRIVEGQIIAVGNEAQAEAITSAIDNADRFGSEAAKKHLLTAATRLRDGAWSDSVRESITAVEAIARMLDPNSRTLGPALKHLEQNGYLHGSLKGAFGKLYGYTSDEEGIRHALVFKAAANVDEADALFMLGACASFVSYLASRAPSKS